MLYIICLRRRHLTFAVKIFTKKDLTSLNSADLNSYTFQRRVVDIALEGYFDTKDLNVTAIEELFAVVMRANHDFCRVHANDLDYMSEFWRDEIENCVI